MDATASPPVRRAGAARMSDEGAEAGDGLADDQVLHLIGAFVGVERLGIRKEPRDLVVGDDSVAAEQLAGPRDRLAALGRAERLGERRMGVSQLAFGLQLRLARTIRHCEAVMLREHFGEKILNQLERADRLSELQALLAYLSAAS